MRSRKQQQDGVNLPAVVVPSSNKPKLLIKRSSCCKVVLLERKEEGQGGKSSHHMGGEGEPAAIATFWERAIWERGKLAAVLQRPSIPLPTDRSRPKSSIACWMGEEGEDSHSSGCAPKSRSAEKSMVVVEMDVCSGRLAHCSFSSSVHHLGEYDTKGLLLVLGDDESRRRRWNGSGDR
uniref:Uncharacterized protein n=1 Tax=Ditylenchus dipsaci TaxID=166011 RepID=A0A915DBA5_9BILA